MSSVEIPLSIIYDSRAGSSIPTEIADFVLPSQWNCIVSDIKSAREEGHLYSCICEAFCCLIFIFPCIFLIHPCASDAVRKSRMQDKLERLNRDLFNDKPVLLAGPDTLIVNVKYLDYGDTSLQYVSRSNTFDQGAILSPINSYTGQPSQEPISPKANKMTVVVPKGALPGSILTVRAPNGRAVTITVPPDGYEGQELIVPYA